MATVNVTTTTADTFKAMAHPLRIRMLELISGTPMTASMLATTLGESTGSTSYHLRQLERHGLIREDEERGTRRERWWKAVGPQAISAEVLRGDPTSARILGESVIGRWNREVERFYNAVVADTLPRDVAEASGLRRARLHLTTAEMGQFGDELMELLERWHAAPGHTDPARPGVMPVIAQFAVFPEMEEES